MAEIQRVHIVGGAGTGNSTLARTLGRQLDVPCYDLDAVGYEGGAGARRPLQARLDDVHHIATQPGWVTEGIFLGWTDELLERANAVVWLDLPFRIAAWRIVVRHIKADLARTNPHPGRRKLGRFLWRVRQYHTPGPIKRQTLDDDNTVTRQDTLIALQPYGPKVIRCRGTTDVQCLTEAFLKDQASGHSEPEPPG